MTLETLKSVQKISEQPTIQDQKNKAQEALIQTQELIKKIQEDSGASTELKSKAANELAQINTLSVETLDEKTIVNFQEKLEKTITALIEIKTQGFESGATELNNQAEDIAGELLNTANEKVFTSSADKQNVKKSIEIKGDHKLKPALDFVVKCISENNLKYYFTAESENILQKNATIFQNLNNYNGSVEKFIKDYNLEASQITGENGILNLLFALARGLNFAKKAGLNTDNPSENTIKINLKTGSQKAEIKINLKSKPKTAVIKNKPAATLKTTANSTATSQTNDHTPPSSTPNSPESKQETDNAPESEKLLQQLNELLKPYAEFEANAEATTSPTATSRGFFDLTGQQTRELIKKISPQHAQALEKIKQFTTENKSTLIKMFKEKKITSPYKINSLYELKYSAVKNEITLYAPTADQFEDCAMERSADQMVQYLRDQIKEELSVYHEFTNILDLNNSKNFLSIQPLELDALISRVSANHLRTVGKIFQFLQRDHELFKRLFSEGYIKKNIPINSFLNINWDDQNKKANFNYPSEDELKNSLYAIYDSKKIHYERTHGERWGSTYIAKAYGLKTDDKNPEKSEQYMTLVDDTIDSATPILSTYYDILNARRAAGRGQIGLALENTGYAVAGAISDLTLLKGVWGIGKVANKSISAGTSIGHAIGKADDHLSTVGLSLGGFRLADGVVRSIIGSSPYKQNLILDPNVNQIVPSRPQVIGYTGEVSTGDGKIVSEKDIYSDQSALEKNESTAKEYIENTIEKLKEDQTWLQIEYEIISPTHLNIWRKGSSRKTAIIRHLDNSPYEQDNGEKGVWQIPKIGKAYDNLSQAIFIGNLLNTTSDWMRKEGHYGGSEKPFSITKGIGDHEEKLKFDAGGTFVDINYLSNDALFFAQASLKVPPSWITNALNEWYLRNQDSLTKNAKQKAEEERKKRKAAGGGGYGAKQIL